MAGGFLHITFEGEAKRMTPSQRQDACLLVKDTILSTAINSLACRPSSPSCGRNTLYQTPAT